MIQLILSVLEPGRNSPSAIVSIPFDFCVSRLQGTDHRSESADDDAMWSCHCARVPHTVEQGQQIQMPLLPQREPPQGRAQGVPMNRFFFLSFSLFSFGLFMFSAGEYEGVWF